MPEGQETLNAEVVRQIALTQFKIANCQFAIAAAQFAASQQGVVSTFNYQKSFSYIQPGATNKIWHQY
jgi:hypothetical protein